MLMVAFSGSSALIMPLSRAASRNAPSAFRIAACAASSSPADLPPLPSGFIVVDKPPGWTSFDVVGKVRGTLERDLKSRGLLEETLVVWAGEFGRTPFAQGSDGRDHNPYGYTIWMAGGGVRPGITYGATDEFGFQTVENPVHVHDLHATILHLMGFDHERLTYRYASRDFRLTDVHGRVIRDIIA